MLGRSVNAKTTLPPGIPGSPYAYLQLHIPLFRSTARRPLALPKRLAVRIVWWGEGTTDPRGTSPGGTVGLVLHPGIAGQQLSQHHRDCQARYPVCVPLHKMQSYLEDMGCLFLDVIDEKTGAVMGRARLEHLTRLTPQNPIRSVVAVANVNGAKIGELTVNLSFELVQANQSRGLLEKNYSSPKVLGDSVEPLSTKLDSKSSDFVNELPMMEAFSEKVNLDEPDRDVLLMKEARADDLESNLSVEVLARIQSALEESRRIRQQVSAEFDAEKKILATNNHFSSSQSNGPTAVETPDLRKADFHSAPDLAIQTEMDLANVEFPPYGSDSYPCLLDGIDIHDMLKNDHDEDYIPNTSANDLSDTDLEKDLIIENALLPSVMEAAQIESKAADHGMIPRPISEAGVLTEESKMEHRRQESQSSCSPTSLMGIRFSFRRLTFPMPIWNALWIVLSAFFNPSEENNFENTYLQEAKKNPRAVKTVRSRSRPNRSKNVIQKRSSDEPFKRAPFKTLPDISGAKPWNLFLEILISASLIDKEANDDQAFQPLRKDLSIWCRRVNLCRRLSKQVLTSSSPSQAPDDPDIIIVPQRNADGDSTLISVNDFEEGSNAPIHLNILCRSPPTFDAPITILIGTIELNLNALIAAMYQMPCREMSKSQSASPKTLRVRIEFVDAIKQRLLKLLDGEYSSSLLKKSFGFVNIEPVSSLSECIKTTSPVPPNFQNSQETLQPFVGIVDTKPIGPFDLDVLLNVRDARDLRLSHPTTASLENSFLVVRIPWCREETFAEDRLVRKAKRFVSAVAWNSGATPTYHFGLRASAILSELPVIQEDAWLQVISPTTGRVCGQLRSRFAVGTSGQISALLDVDRENAAAGCLDWRPVDFIRWKEPSIFNKFRDYVPNEQSSNSEALMTFSATHALDIQLTALTNFQPDLSATLQKELGIHAFLHTDCDCFIQYRIPVDLEQQVSTFRSPVLQLQSICKPEDVRAPRQHKESGVDADEMDCRETSGGMELKWQDEGTGGWHEVHEHTFVIESSRETEIIKNIRELDSYAFLDWLGRGRSTQEDGIPFELWLRLYSPKLREVRIAEGSVPWALLEKHLVLAPSMSNVDKVADFPSSWEHDLSQHILNFYDVLTNKVLGRLMLNVKYRLTYKAQCSTELGSKYSADNDANCSLCHHKKIRICQLRPSTVHPGIRLNVSLLSLTGLGAVKAPQIRMHCLLLLPSTNFCHRHTVFPHLLASSAVKSPISIFYGDSKEQTKMRLDVLLPLAWQYESLVENQPVGNQKPSRGETFTTFSLAEALAFGAVEINDRHSWLNGRVSRPCLVIQVDVWDLTQGSHVNCQGNSKSDVDTPVNFWGINYNGESGLRLRPSSRYRLLATCRIALSDLLSNSSPPPRLIALLQVSSLQKSSLFRTPDSSLSAMPTRLAGAVEISTYFEGTSAQRKMLEEVSSLASPRALRSLRELGFDLNSMESSSRVLGITGNIESNNDLHEFSLCFTSLRLPKEASLLDPFELEECRERKLKGFFLIRAVLDADIRISSPHPLPLIPGDKSSAYGKCGIVHFQNTLTFCAVSGVQLIKSALEIQVWAKWLPSDSAIETESIPVPRFLGLVRLPLSHIFRNHSPVDPEEVFYWTYAPWESTFILNSIAVYPLFQPSAASLDDCWIAFKIASGKDVIQYVNHPTSEEAALEHGVLTWYSEGQVLRSGLPDIAAFKQISSPPKVHTFPAYISIERANRLSSDSKLNDVENVGTFATFMVPDDNSSEQNFQRMVTTPLATDRVQPVWNYFRYAHLHLFYINGDAKCFTVDLWQRAQDHQHPHYLGTAKMPLTALSLPQTTTSLRSSAEISPVGLEFLRGWYEIYDTQGDSRGQLLMGVYPLAENEENPKDRRFCQRLERLLDPRNVADVEISISEISDEEPPKTNISDSENVDSLEISVAHPQHRLNIASKNNVELQTGNTTDAFMCDSISLASTATLPSVSSLLMKEHFSRVAADDVPVEQNEDPDCSSSWSASSADVEEYVQRFRQNIKEKKARASALFSSEKACIDPGSGKHKRGRIKVTETSLVEGGEQAKVVDPSDNNSEVLPPKNTEGDIWENASVSVSCCYLEATKNDHEVADSERFQQPQRVSLRMPSPTQCVVEDSFRPRIPPRLSSTTDECLQDSQVTIPTGLKSPTDNDPPASN
ncbi:hypothetical protein Aperf_G00000054564 [Anoplocephala perfoliata]